MADADGSQECVKCGRIFPLQHARCPNCGASMLNRNMTTGDLAQRELDEWVDCRWSPGMRKQYAFGALLGAVAHALIYLVFHAPPWWAYPLAALWGALLGGIIAFRCYGSFGGLLVYGGGGILFAALLGNINFFSWVALPCAGAVIGIWLAQRHGYG
jgi:predicted RNA-binding Zn-ribbon protein involved in translation (DUF1610 family)